MKANVIPVDTHVHQIAIKYYGMPGSKTKGAMNAKLYEQVNTKLTVAWGEYAGWAHSVSYMNCSVAIDTKLSRSFSRLT